MFYGDDKVARQMYGSQRRDTLAESALNQTGGLTTLDAFD